MGAPLFLEISKHICNALKEEMADEVFVAKFAISNQHGTINNGRD